MSVELPLVVGQSLGYCSWHTAVTISILLSELVGINLLYRVDFH
jgi:hypothetical protein